MKKIKDLVEKTDRYKDIIIQKEFASKKNTVAYVTIDGKPRVLKWFVPGLKKNLENEYKILMDGKADINIPNVFEKDKENNVLILNYIIGENLCDIINDQKTTKKEKERLIILLAEWYIDFHKHYRNDTTFMIHGDSNLRNFLLTDRIWGVDFEETRKGRPIEDISRMCASILTTDPMFTTEKYDLCQKFIEYYSKNVQWNLTNVNNEISYALLERIQWRPSQEEMIRKHSKKIRKKGL